MTKTNDNLKLSCSAALPTCLVLQSHMWRRLQRGQHRWGAAQRCKSPGLRLFCCLLPLVGWLACSSSHTCSLEFWKAHSSTLSPRRPVSLSSSLFSLSISMHSLCASPAAERLASCLLPPASGLRPPSAAPGPEGGRVKTGQRTMTALPGTEAKMSLWRGKALKSQRGQTRLGRAGGRGDMRHLSMGGGVAGWRRGVCEQKQT